jgi:hypothetical protein
MRSKPSTTRAEGTRNKAFDEYFVGRFRAGEFVVDNNLRNLSTINAILRRRELIP